MKKDARTSTSYDETPCCSPPDGATGDRQYRDFDSNFGCLKFMTSFGRIGLACLLIALCLPVASAQTNWYVLNQAGWATALAGAATDSAAGQTDTINIESSFYGTVQQSVNANVIINGNGSTINMQNDDRALFIAGGTVSISNLTIVNGNATGGASAYGGGAGAGLGGAIFVGSGTYATANGNPAVTGISAPNVTLSNVSFSNNAAVGGNAMPLAYDVLSINAGGGGGLGGAGGRGAASGNNSGVGGGGGLGNGATGGNASYPIGTSTAGGNGSLLNVSTGSATAGGNGGNGSDSNGTSGGLSAGGGGAGGPGNTAGSGGGGGVGGERGYYQNLTPPNQGGSGGFGGGGGGGYFGGGNGGFGGGGGQASYGYDGGDGGFGGGGGASSKQSAAGTGGWGAGQGNTYSSNETSYSIGGGGLGAGGALFVSQGATVTLTGSLGISNNSAIAGAAGGPNVGYGGQAFGSGLFLQGSGTLNFAPGAGQTQTISDTIEDEVGANSTGYIPPTGTFDPTHKWGLNENGSGTLVLSGANYYSGDTIVDSGTLEFTVGGSIYATNTSLIVGRNPGSSAAFALSGGIASFGYISLGNAAGSLGMATISSGTWSTQHQLSVGNIGSGSLSLSGGLISVSGTSFIGDNGGIATASISGGTWATTGDLDVGGDTNGNSGTGSLNISGGTVTVGGTLRLGSSGGNGTLTVAGGGTLTASSIAFGNGTNTINFNQSNNFTLNTVISGDGSLNQFGSGTTILNGSNIAFTGPTIITNGTLETRNDFALGSSGNVTLGGGKLAPIGLSGANSMNWNSGSLLMGLGTTNLSVFIIGGNLANGGSGGTFSFYDSGGFALNTRYSVVYWGSESGFTSSNFTGNNLDGGTPNFSTNNGTLSVEFTAVPETSTYILFSLGMLAMLVAYRPGLPRHRNETL